MTHSKQEFTPKLRFPDFRDEPAWTAEPLRESATVITEKAGERKCVYLSITSGVGLISQVEKFGRTIAGESYKNYLLIQRNNFAYNKSATKEFPQGFIAMYSGDEPGSVPNSIYTCFRVHEDRINVQYLDYLFLGNLHGRWLRKYITVGARAHGSLSINDEDLMSLPIPRPSGKSSLYEQQKIVDCLSSLDELIVAHSRKLDALKSYMKGLMQQLFPCEGETFPRRRFPEFKEAPEWKQETLGDIAAISSGSTPLRSNPQFHVGGNIPWVKTTDLNNSFIYRTEECITTEAKATINPVGSVLVAMYGGFKQIGRTGYLKVPAATNQALSVLRVNHSAVLPDYVLVWLNAKVETWKRIASSSRKDPNITGSDVACFPICYPTTLSEQRLIADCLLSLDERVAVQAQEIDVLKIHKKGLMQQLFPSPDEVEA